MDELSRYKRALIELEVQNIQLVHQRAIALNALKMASGHVDDTRNQDNIAVMEAAIAALQMPLGTKGRSQLTPVAGNGEQDE